MESGALERPGLTREEIEELKSVFDMFDTDHTGKIDTHELKSAIMALGFEKHNKIIYDLLCEIEKKNTSLITFPDLLDIMTVRITPTCTKAECQKIFQIYDNDNQGTITLEKLLSISKQLGEVLTEDDLKEMIIRADSDGDGAVTFGDFYHLMTKRSL